MSRSKSLTDVLDAIERYSPEERAQAVTAALRAINTASERRSISGRRRKRAAILARSLERILRHSFGDRRERKDMDLCKLPSAD